ncbi:hypothetical protein NK718_02475 [Alsobacter sp. SYSU M60028]|uniref:Transcriptional regulator n=1 Tax=Alsobacter ponti TaxID=2962936 RepID=A0ABT1LAT4_9HYPH|nr:hypothetical protein [Alsobacter ponti]MCP8937368.1 hypothetical protein [Alsobacter ponti]
MANADVKQFDLLRKAYKDAGKARKEAARAVKAVKGLGGPRSGMEAIASSPGKRAVNAELDALRDQALALEKMLAFAIARVNDTADEPEGGRALSKGKKAKAEEIKDVGKSPSGPGSKKKKKKKKAGKAV